MVASCIELDNLGAQPLTSMGNAWEFSALCTYFAPASHAFTNRCTLHRTQGLEQVYLAIPPHGECATDVKYDVVILFVTCAAAYTKEILPDPTSPIMLQRLISTRQA